MEKNSFLTNFERKAKDLFHYYPICVFVFKQYIYSVYSIKEKQYIFRNISEAISNSYILTQKAISNEINILFKTQNFIEAKTDNIHNVTPMHKIFLLKKIRLTFQILQ